MVKTYMSRPLEKALLILNPWVNVNWDNWEPESWYSIRRKILFDKYLRYAELHSLVGYDYSKKCLDVRSYLQLLGTEIGRNMFGQNVWTDVARHDITTSMNEGQSVVITGMRFKNEMAMVKALGGVLVWVTRPGFAPVNDHVSDNAVGPKDFDLVLKNDGSLAELHIKAHTLVSTIQEGTYNANDDL